MLSTLKGKAYFPIAHYFKFFAAIRLKSWKPQIVVVTGSAGKTTLLHLIESQLGEDAKYSHHANSAFGIPFNILGLKRKSLTPAEWPKLFLLAPLSLLKKFPSKKIYIVEADCDRPKEGEFLSKLLKPDITLITSISRTHTQNFDSLVENGKFKSVEEAIAHEFGNFLRNTSKMVIYNADTKLIRDQCESIKATKVKINKKMLQSYSVAFTETEFKIEKKSYKFKSLLPEGAFYAVAMTLELLKQLNKKTKINFENFHLPPGRSTVFKGIKNIKIIDSTYNATPSSVFEILNMFKKIKAENKWIVLGDMVELGKEEEYEHEMLSERITAVNPKKVILVGPRLSKYTYPKLISKAFPPSSVYKFELPKDALAYMQKNLKGEEAILFKGARFLEGIIEKLLLNKNDIGKLPRREKAWTLRRKQWGL